MLGSKEESSTTGRENLRALGVWVSSAIVKGSEIDDGSRGAELTAISSDPCTQAEVILPFVK